MRKIFLFVALALLIGGQTVYAASILVQPLSDVHIQYKQVGWQVYNFQALTNLSADKTLKYNWTVDGRESFNAPILQYFFPMGSHVVSVAVQDQYGNIKQDSVRMNITFWSLSNNWVFWLAYLFVFLLFTYYWLVKIFYLFNRQRLNRRVRNFMDVLDEHGFIEKLAIRLSNKSTRRS